MSDTEKKTMVSKIGELASLKDIITGVLVIVGVIGGLYGSLKPESLAQKSHENLAPIVDVANEAAENNSTELKDQSMRLRILEEKFGLVEMMNTIALSKSSGEIMDLEDLYRLFAKRYGKENPEHKHPVRERVYEQKMEIKPRAKTYWEAPKNK